MITVRLSGGLGNQMFQYALGRALSLKAGQKLALDLSAYDSQKPNEAQRRYQLDIFPIKAELTKQTASQRIWRAIKRSFESSKPLRGKTVILEPSFAFVPEVLEAKDGTYLSGVWQSEKYFKTYEQDIRADFKLKNPLSPKAVEIKKLMKSSDSVSAHIRRGDQVSDPKLLAKHGLLTDEYYSDASEYMKSRLNEPRFFVFSDEIEWVKANLGFGPDAVFVSTYGLPDYEELMLMASCKHNIIAKSSFSWWGAWLNQNENKIVIAPKQRFGNERSDDKDLIPEAWVQL